MRKTSALLAFIAVIAAPNLFAQEVGRSQETWTWDGRVSSGNWFRLSTINGPVVIERSTDGQVHVRAEKIAERRGEITDVAFVVLQSAGDVRICAVWRNDVCDEDGMHSRRRNDDDDRNRHDTKVRFTIKVPSGVKVSAGTVNGEMRVRDLTSEVRASTVNGRVEVANVGGPVRATTVNGTVDVTTRSGPVTATTVNGDIDVRMTELDNGTGDMEFHTVNGGITVETPSSLNARVSMETMHGSISSDYPVQLSGRFGPRHAEGTIGRGGRDIEMHTVNGSIELRKR